MTPIDTKDIVTICIALYGAGLSTFIFVTQRINKRRKIRVKVKYGFEVPNGAKLLLINAANVGQVDVTIDSFALRTSLNWKLMFPPSQQEFRLPHELKPGQSVTFQFPLTVLLQTLVGNGYHSLVHLVPVVDDQDGVTYCGKTIRFDITKWQELIAKRIIRNAAEGRQ